MKISKLQEENRKVRIEFYGKTYKKEIVRGGRKRIKEIKMVEKNGKINGLKNNWLKGDVVNLKGYGEKKYELMKLNKNYWKVKCLETNSVGWHGEWDIEGLAF